jgi:hypothetical protein
VREEARAAAEARIAQLERKHAEEIGAQKRGELNNSASACPHLIDCFPTAVRCLSIIPTSCLLAWRGDAESVRQSVVEAQAAHSSVLAASVGDAAGALAAAVAAERAEAAAAAALREAREKHELALAAERRGAEESMAALMDTMATMKDNIEALSDVVRTYCKRAILRITPYPDVAIVHVVCTCTCACTCRCGRASDCCWKRRTTGTRARSARRPSASACAPRTRPPWPRSAAEVRE